VVLRHVDTGRSPDHRAATLKVLEKLAIWAGAANVWSDE